MTRNGLRRDQQTRANVFAQVDVLVWCQQRHGGLISAANGNKAVHKVLPAFLQVYPPLANGAGQLIAIGIHRGVIVIIVRQT